MSRLGAQRMPAGSAFEARVHDRPSLSASEGCRRSGAQPRFQSWGSNSLVYGITTLLQKKINRYTQFCAVGYIITPYSSKSYIKSWGSIQILGRSGPPDSPMVASMPKVTINAMPCERVKDELWSDQRCRAIKHSIAVVKAADDDSVVLSVVRNERGTDGSQCIW